MPVHASPPPLGYGTFRGCVVCRSFDRGGGSTDDIVRFSVYESYEPPLPQKFRQGSVHRLELSDEPNFGLEMLSTLTGNGVLDMLNQFPDVPGRCPAEVDHDVGVDM